MMKQRIMEIEEERVKKNSFEISLKNDYMCIVKNVRFVTFLLFLVKKLIAH
jgi:hypothetical protein